MAEEIEREVWEKVTPLLHNAGIMAELIAKLEKMDLLGQTVAGYDDIITKARKSLDRLTLAKTSLDEEDPENEEVLASLERGIEEQKQILKEAKKAQEQILPEAQVQERRRASIKKFLAWANKTNPALKENPTLTEKRDALSALGVTIYAFPARSDYERWRMEIDLEDFNLRSC